ncbi:recombinase family protein [Salinisphaera sp. USBA-960]|nr:recombinase family protein [Salifodinibacter halophilus]NNC26010.1 recombinase family protein [Salifodinibacter halophilus]
MTKRAAIYARVSTDQQTTRNQIDKLREVAAAKGWEVVAEFIDEGISGAKGRDKRPQFDALHRAAVRSEFDIIMSWSVDRLGRSLQDLVGFLSELQGNGVDLFLHQQDVNTTTPAGKAMFQMMGVFAEFERSIIQDRVNAGLDRARAMGKTLGRPRVGDEKTEARVRELREQGHSYRQAAKMAGVSVGKVQRILKEAEANP